MNKSNLVFWMNFIDIEEKLCCRGRPNFIFCFLSPCFLSFFFLSFFLLSFFPPSFLPSSFADLLFHLPLDEEEKRSASTSLLGTGGERVPHSHSSSLERSSRPFSEGSGTPFHIHFSTHGLPRPPLPLITIPSVS